MSKAKKLYKSSTDKKIDGVCAGFADYLEIDVTVVRVLYLALTIFTGVIPGVIAYIAMSLIMPREGESNG